MKKVLLMSALAVAGLFSAQETEKSEGLKGTWYATAQVGFSQTKTGDSKDSYFNVLPIVGTFISPDVTVGLAFGYLNYKEQAGGSTSTDIQAFAVQPLARKYWNISGPLYFFGQLAVPLVFGKEKESDLKISQYGIGASAGLDMVVWKSVSLEFSYNIANVSVTTLKPTAGDNSTTITNFQLAHVANDTKGYEQVGLLTPLSVGVKFLF